MEYKIVVAVEKLPGYATSALEKMVQEKVRQGWKPVGGVSLMHVPSTGYYFASQAIIK